MSGTGEPLNRKARRQAEIDHFHIVKVILGTDTADVVWSGGDGKPRCAHHPYICLVRARSVGIKRNGHVCAACMKEAAV